MQGRGAGAGYLLKLLHKVCEGLAVENGWLLADLGQVKECANTHSLLLTFCRYFSRACLRSSTCVDETKSG